ncbi:hypothetical protein MAA_10527 [Metarhizium robertsii ARSEF 23]|nr:uncharacterized protein MAA_10527 [Metarhizium robertsii ARSEF 23]EFY94010.2 hypothetical protein MAA_10527 [Metarhizium robertsii ARSEF 23]
MASARAKTMYRTKCKESVPDADGFFHWKFEPIFDRMAFEIVMNIIHGQTHLLPDKVTLDTLAHVAAITDDLQCHNAVKFVTDAWLERMQTSPPKEICPDLRKWILVASVLHQPDIFQSTTRLAIVQCRGPLLGDDIPIPPTIIDAIESMRIQLLGELTKEVEQTIDRLSRGNSPCTFECRSMLLGALIQETQCARIRLSDSFGSLPNISLTTALSDIRNFRSPDIYTSLSEYDGPMDEYQSRESNVAWKLERVFEEHGHASYSKKDKKHRKRISAADMRENELDAYPRTLFRHQCSIVRLFEPFLQKFEASITGLNLSDFSGME